MDHSSVLRQQSQNTILRTRHEQNIKTPASVSKPAPFALNSKENNVGADEACSENMNLLSLKDTASIPKGDKVEDFQHDHAALLRILRNEGESLAMIPHGKPNHLPQRVSIMKSRQKPDTIPHPGSVGSVKSVQFSRDIAAMQSITRDQGIKAGVPSDRAPSIYTPMRVPVKKNAFDTGLTVQFSRDCAAMQSITKDEGVKAGVPLDRPPSIYTPMRVPVKKSGTDTGPRLTGSSTKTVQFSPDVAALQSILQNEGVKTMAPDGASQRNSVCPTGRGTSIYMAQRVPIRKNLADPSTGLMGPTLTPGQKWAAQRVTRPKPMSVMRWQTLSQQSPYGSTLGFRNYKENICTNKEEVVQKLFVEDEQTPDEEAVTELFQDHTTHKQETQSPVRDEEAEDDLMKEDDRAVGPFVQALQRESVIFFSTGKKLFRDHHFKKTEKKEKEPWLEEVPVLHQKCLTSALGQSVTKDQTQKTNVMNPARPTQQKPLPPLEELRLDEEVATYTSTFVPSMPRFHAPQPRCGNPLATLLHFEEATKFVPISLDMSPVSPLER
uniref:Uncharacterized protein n=1 Tax=Knipowitschia caucasica TaxID=637954 RepID=A0AAV2LYH0_KNICA